MLKDRVRSYIEFSGISKTLFAKRLNITPQYLYQWLKGEKNISLQLEARINTYLDKYYVK